MQDTEIHGIASRYTMATNTTSILFQLVTVGMGDIVVF